MAGDQEINLAEARFAGCVLANSTPPHHAKTGRAGDPGTGRPAAARKALRAVFYGPTEQLAEKVTKDDKTIPQGLKPASFWSSYGTGEAVPLQNGAFFRKL
jgi:hypothetical protein